MFLQEETRTPVINLTDEDDDWTNNIPEDDLLSEETEKSELSESEEDLDYPSEEDWR